MKSAYKSVHQNSNLQSVGFQVGSLFVCVLVLESCGARFLAPRPQNAPLFFAPTRTGPKNNKSYGPDPGPDRTETI